MRLFSIPKFIKNKPKKILCLLIFGLLILSIVIYYLIVIIIARINTPALIEAALKSESVILGIDDLSERQIDILLAVEDPNFYRHNGVDLTTPGAGITTITQSLVKSLYFRNFKPGIAKIKQTLIARFVLNPMVSKNDQLRLFINEAYFGSVDDKPIYGFAKASSIYFGKSFSELNEDEYISLVAMLIAPQRFNVKNCPEANADRVERIKCLIAGEYKPKGLMDLHYGGEYYTESRNFVSDFFERLIWGY